MGAFSSAVEQQTFNLQVEGSIPSGPTKLDIISLDQRSIDCQTSLLMPSCRGSKKPLFAAMETPKG